MLQAYSLCGLQQIKKPHHNQPSPHTEKIPLELTADVALIVNIKILLARETKSHDVTGLKCSWLNCVHTELGMIQSNIAGFRRCKPFIAVGNELHALIWQRNGPAVSCTGADIPQWWVWPNLHSFKSELTITSWLMITEAVLRIPWLRSLQQLHHTPHIEINLLGTAVLPQYILRIS